MTWADCLEIAQLSFYRGGGFMVLNVLDDPAWMALIFC